MNWSDERYVRVFTRDTVEWLSWSWQARALFVELLRKVDRAGCLDLPSGTERAVKGLSRLVGMPEQVVAEFLPELAESGAVVMGDRGLVIRNFVEAQEATASHAERQRRYRERQLASAARDAASPLCLPAHEEVTKADARVTEVTPSVPSVPSVPSSQSVPASPGRPLRAKKPKPEASQEAREVAAYLADAIRSHQPTAKLQPENWAEAIDAAMRIDRRTPEDLRLAIDWAHRRDPRMFWRPNLRSGAKLREHFDRLESERASHGARASPRLGPAAPIDLTYAPDLSAYED